MAGRPCFGHDVIAPVNREARWQQWQQPLKIEDDADELNERINNDPFGTSGRRSGLALLQLTN